MFTPNREQNGEKGRDGKSNTDGHVDTDTWKERKRKNFSNIFTLRLGEHTTSLEWNCTRYQVYGEIRTRCLLYTFPLLFTPKREIEA